MSSTFNPDSDEKPSDSLADIPNLDAGELIRRRASAPSRSKRWVISILLACAFVSGWAGWASLWNRRADDHTLRVTVEVWGMS